MLNRFFESLLNLVSTPSEEEPSDFDFGSGKITEKLHHREELDAPGGPLTVHEAFMVVEPEAKRFDLSARLTRIVSGPGLDAEGKTLVWNFHYQFPERWAHAIFSTHSQPVGSDQQAEYLEFSVTPFPAPGSAMAKMLSEGQGGFVEQQWQVELERCEALPTDFSDSAEVFAQWAKEGFDVHTLSPTVKMEALSRPLGGAVWRLSDPASGQKKLKEGPLK